MTLDPTSDEREAQALEAALAGLHGAGASTPPAETADDSALAREHLEVFGLLPYELDPAEPSPDVRQRILSRIAAAVDSGRRVDDLTLVQSVRREMVTVEPEPSVGAVDRTLVRMPAPQAPANDIADVETLASASVLPHVAPSPPPRASSGWGTFAMAAALGICLLGMGFFSGKMFEQTATIERLSHDLQSAIERENALRADVDEMTRMRNNFQMITSVARQVYPMHPASTAAATGTGTVYVCGRHERWYLNLHGLEPPPSGHEYQLWFMTEKGLVPGGTVAIGTDSGELGAPTMPRNTQGFAVSLETAGFHSEPEGSLLLIGDKPVSL